VDVLEAMAKGDFTRSLREESRDETGQMAVALNHAIQDVRAVLRQARAEANRVAASSSTVSDATAQIAAGTEEQAASLEETATAVEGISATAASNARNATKLLTESLRNAEQSSGEFSRAVTSVVGWVRGIHDSSARMSDVADTIDQFAFQTNILALNAAVEAARAGDQGRGSPPSPPRSAPWRCARPRPRGRSAG
jgi:methyl-accepting chemotaxis protein